MLRSENKNWTRHMLWGLIDVVVFVSLLTGGCGDTASQSGKPDSVSINSTTVPVSAPQDVTIRFTDVTSAAGLAFKHESGATGKKWYPETMGAGGGFFDYDGDGRLDILLVNGRRWPGERQPPEPTLRLYRNQGDGTFGDVTRQSGLDVPLYGMGMAAADYDNDGDADLLITAYQQTILFRNEGDGTFHDVSLQAGIEQGAWSSAAAFVDVDRDGLVDLFIGYYVDWDPSKEESLNCTYGTPDKDYCAVKFFKGQGLRLYRNLGNGRFRDMTAKAGVASPDARVLGLTVVDYNQDGWPDLLVANDLTPSLFFANQGDGTFQEIGVQSGFVLDEGGVAFAGMGIDATYINNDEQLCVAIGNFSGQPTTLHCQARVAEGYRPDVFVEQSHRVGLARPTLRRVTFGLFFFDVDLDGWQDLFMVNGHVVNEEQLRNVPYAQRPQLFRNGRNGTFIEVEPEAQSGLDIQLVGRGASYADYDSDGDLDLLLTANQGQAYLLRNDTQRSGHFFRIVTQGKQSNRDGIGAQIRLYTDRRQLGGMIRTGSSYLSQSEMPVTFGLQSGERIDRLEVAWPSGVVDVFHPSRLDTTFVAREGTAPAQTRVAKQPSAPTAPGPPITLKRTATAHYQAGRLQDAISAFQQVLKRHPSDYLAQQYLIELYWRQGAQEQARTLLAGMSQALPEANFLMQFAFHMEDLELQPLANLIYQEAARVDPKIPEAHYRQGKNALEAGRYDRAIAHFRQALQRHPGLVDAQQGIGLAYTEQGKNAQAEAQFRQVLQLAPDHAEAYAHLGHLYGRTNRLDEAVHAYKQVIRLRPERAQGYHNLGTVLAAQGQAEAAIEQFQNALRRDPRYLAAHNDLGTLYADQGKIDQAIAEFEAALRIDPGSVHAHYNLSMAHAARGNPPAMQRELRETLRLDPQHLEAHFNLGVGYLQQEKHDAAVKQFRTLVQIAPGMANGHYLLAMAYAQRGQADAMLSALQRTVRLDPKHAKAHSTLASLYFQRQQYDLAWQHGQKAAQLGAPVQQLLEALQQVRGERR